MYITQNGILIDAKIKSSIYETNYFLLEKQSNLSFIEYAVFFGSIQIFNNLRLEGAKLTPLL